MNKFIKRSKKLNGEKYTYEKVEITNGIKTKVCLNCKIHGYFYQNVYDHIYGNKSGCPKCNESKGEKSIRVFLENENVEYIKNKTFDKCKYKRNLYFDFYLVDYNICIEFDGIQHETGWRYNYKTKTINKNIEQSKNIQKIRDNIKTNFCKENNIKLLRISYRDYEKIENILIDLLNL